MALGLLLACGAGLHALPERPVTDPSLLLARMSERKAALGPVFVSARVENYSAEGVAKGRITMLLDPTGRIRVDAWSPSDSLLAALYADRNIFTYFERGAPECITGGPCRANLDRVLPLGLDLLDAIVALQGFPPERPAASAWTIAFDRRVGAYRMTSMAASGGTQSIWVREDGVPVRAEYSDAAGRRYRMECSDIRNGRPWQIRLVDDAGKRDVTFRFRSLEAADLPVEEWVVTCPDGLPINKLKCEAPQ